MFKGGLEDPTTKCPLLVSNDVTKNTTIIPSPNIIA